jgi:hypothetical protein
MAWLPASVPDSAKLLLNKTGVKEFSKPQALAAIPHWYASLPLVYRVQLARDYADQLPAGGEKEATGKATLPPA